MANAAAAARPSDVLSDLISDLASETGVTLAPKPEAPKPEAPKPETEAQPVPVPEPDAEVSEPEPSEGEPVEAMPHPLGHNQPPKDKFASEADALKHYGKLGTRAAAGQLVGAEFLALVAENCRDKLHEVSRDKAKEIYKAFVDAKVAKMGRLANDGKRESNTEQKTSNVYTVMRASSWPGVDFPAVLTLARPIIVATKDDHKKNTWDAFMAIAVAQNNQRDRQLSESEIEQALAPKSGNKDTSEKAQLKVIIKALERLIKGAEPSDTYPEGRKGYPSDRAKMMLKLGEEQIAICNYEAARAALPTN